MPPLTDMATLRSPTDPEQGLCGGTGSFARILAAGEQEIARVMQICNACRYCEGFCAVFPAMTRRLEFDKADAHYLANLCHNCGSCLYACQYAPPHEFAVNVPLAMAKVRVRTYQEYAWPVPLGRLYERAGLTVALALAGGLALFLALAVAMNGRLVHEPLAGHFYAIFPHNFLAVLFSIVLLFAVLALGVGVTKFWREISPTIDGDPRGTASMAGVCVPATAEAVSDVARLRYLGGGHGKGCNEEDDLFTPWRRRFHQLSLYGFLLCLAATSMATLYHYLFAWEAPYTFLSVPVILGSLGGFGLIVGPAGLLWLNMQRDSKRGDSEQNAMDRGFIALLLLVSATGFALLVLRDTSFMALWLAIHLGTVMALFLTLPYGKFAHGVFRSAALLKFNIEKRMPSKLSLGSD
jgi:citrate/tricarballylate utilization protein